MFYAEIKRPIYLKGEQQELYAKINKEFGVKYGIYLIKEGTIETEKGKAQYWDYLPLFENLPTYRSNWDDLTPIQKVGDKEFTVMNLFLENGLLLKRLAMVELHEVNYLSDKEEGVYLLLCSVGDYYFQVITG